MLNQAQFKHLLLLGAVMLFLSNDSICMSNDSKQFVKNEQKIINKSVNQNLILKKLSFSGISNFIKISPQLYSGGMPEHEMAFKNLSLLGIKTIISVDGQRPQLSMAKKHGLKYVHVPIGYDGIFQQERFSFLRIVKEYPRPFFFHCHHGKHRGPSSAAIACIAMHQITNDEALKILAAAGTSQEYSGLWSDVKKFKVPTDNPDFPELHEAVAVSSIASAMVKINERFESLAKLIQTGKSKVSRPDKERDDEIYSAMEQSLLLLEDFNEMKRNLTSEEDSSFSPMLSDSQKHARNLYQSFKSGKMNLSRERYVSLKKSCNQCHRHHRN